MATTQNLAQNNPVTVCVRTRPASVIASELTVDAEANVRILCRYMPVSWRTQMHSVLKYIAYVMANQTIGIVAKKSEDSVDNKQKNWLFKYNRVMHMVSQDTVYEGHCATVVNSVLEGRNGVVNRSNSIIIPSEYPMNTHNSIYVNPLYTDNCNHATNVLKTHAKFVQVQLSPMARLVRARRSR